MDITAIWPIIQGVLVNLISSMIDGRKQVITIENINAMIADEIRVCGNNAIIRSFDHTQLQEFLREFLSTVTFLQLRLDEVRLRMDGLAQSHTKQTEQLEVIATTLNELASERVLQRRKIGPGAARTRRSASQIFRDVEDKIAKGSATVK